MEGYAIVLNVLKVIGPTIKYGVGGVVFEVEPRSCKASKSSLRNLKVVHFKEKYTTPLMK